MAANTKLSDDASQTCLLPPAAFGPPKNIVSHPPCKPAVASLSADSLDHQNLAPPDLFQPSREMQAPEINATKNHRGQGDSINSEVERLRRENYKLMEEAVRRNEKQVPAPCVYQYPPPNNQSHLDTLINKQAEEISSLKSKLTDMERDSCMLKQSKEEEALRKEHLHRTELQQLQVKLESCNHEAKENMEKVLNEHKCIKKSWEEEKVSMNTHISRRTEELKHAENQMIEHTRAKQANATENSNLKSKIMEQEETISQMKTYMKSLQKTQAQGEQWPSVKAELEAKLAQAQQEKESLTGDVCSLNMRLSAISEILTIQEASLAENSEVNTTKQEKQLELLNKWRHKVLQLLVQQKSDELTKAKENQTHQMKIDVMKDEIQELRNHVIILSNTVKDRDAQIAMTTNRIKHLEVALNTTDSELRDVQSERDSAIAFNKDMANNVQSACSNCLVYSDKLSQIESRISDYEDRILTAQRIVVNCSAQTGLAVQKKLECETLLEQRQERINALENKVVDFELSTNHQKQKMAEMQESIVRQHTELEERRQLLDELKEELAGHTGQRHLQVERIQLEAERQYKDKLLQSDFIISETKKELAKSVLSLRQAERRCERICDQLRSEKDELALKLERVEAEYASHMSALEVEKNILKATARQSSVVMERASPRKFSEKTTPIKSNPLRDRTNETVQSNPDGERQSLIGSARKLAAEVLNSSSDNEVSDDDQS